MDNRAIDVTEQKDNIVEKTPLFYIGFSTNLRRFFLGLTAIFAFIIAVKSLSPAMPTLSISYIDKVAHLCAYLLLGAVALPAFASVKPIFVWAGLCVFGASIEITQGLLNTGRTLDPLDGIANATGALLAVGIWIIITWLAQKFT